MFVNPCVRECVCASILAFVHTYVTECVCVCLREYKCSCKHTCDRMFAFVCSLLHAFVRVRVFAYVCACVRECVNACGRVFVSGFVRIGAFERM